MDVCEAWWDLKCACVELQKIDLLFDEKNPYLWSISGLLFLATSSNCDVYLSLGC